MNGMIIGLYNYLVELKRAEMKAWAPRAWASIHHWRGWSLTIKFREVSKPGKNGRILLKFDRCLRSRDACQIPERSDKSKRISHDLRWHKLQKRWFTVQWIEAQQAVISLQWRHNERNGVSNHQPHDCLPNGLFRRRSRKTSKLRVTGLCAGNSRWIPRTNGQ